jgi:hypothetical protein
LPERFLSLVIGRWKRGAKRENMLNLPLIVQLSVNSPPQKKTFSKLYTYTFWATMQREPNKGMWEVFS